jgi:segregation and condensation protein B
MSLKAKMEAVIYASEEPVTLTQLISLLGEEAQAELDRAAAEESLAQPALALEDAAAAPDPAAPATPPATAESVIADPESPAPGADTAAAKAEKARAARLRSHFRAELDKLVAQYADPALDRGIEVREVAGGFRFATKPEYHDAVRGFVKSLKPPLKLTLQSLETLAVIAYKQPVTAHEISEIRGVDSSGVLGSLIARKLITTAGRKQVIGRPILYKTTKEFLLKFGLKDVNELPSIEEFEKMAGQMAEQEEMDMPESQHHAPETIEELELEKDVSSPQADGDSSPTGNVTTEDRASIAFPSVDGRISSLPPDYTDEDLADDPDAQEAAIQSSEAGGSGSEGIE